MKLFKNPKTGLVDYRRLLLFLMFWSTILALVVSSYYVFSRLNTRFKETVSWEKKDPTPMANLEAYALYLGKEEKAIHKKYNDKLHEIYIVDSKDFFGNNVEQEDIDELKKYYDQLTDGLKQKEEKTYLLVNSVWNSKKDFLALFNPITNTVNKKTKIEDITKYLDNHHDFILTNKDKYPLLQTFYEFLKVVERDVSYINNLMLIVNDTFNMKDKKLEVKPDTTVSKLTHWGTNRKEIKLKWDIVTNFLDKAISRSYKIFDKHQETINKNKQYAEALENKQAFEAWDKAYKEYKTQLTDLPNFENKKIDDVKKWAEENGVILKITTDYSEDIDENVVISQKSKNKKILKGSVLTVTVSIGERPTTTSTTTESTSEESSTRTTDPITVTDNSTEDR